MVEVTKLKYKYPSRVKLAELGIGSDVNIVIHQ